MTTVPVELVHRADAEAVGSTLEGTTFTWRAHAVATSLVGGYNVENSLMAMSIMTALGASAADVAAAMVAVRGVPGRFEVIAHAGVTVVVDYAHTPEGLRRLLGDVRDLAPHARVACVFGCGGDRDREKRPEMGRIASTLADLSVVTSDNPRGEDPDAIIDAIMVGIEAGRDVRRVADRRQAIGEALTWASSGDVVVVAGKGHENTQTIGDRVVEFDDRAVVRELMR
jgi:UDP-N-acetylmuramoyl-L-alanyl-D-glutamate--2,6-diaminopimelate ligase